MEYRERSNQDNKMQPEACPEPPEDFVTVVEDGFGIISNEDGTKNIVRRYTFTNQNYLIIQIITYGASIVSVKYPDKNGISEDVVLGFDDLPGYMMSGGCASYFGAIIGRCANRISKGHFKIGNEDFQLSTNFGEHHFHGGFIGFHKVNWDSQIQDKKVVMSHLSKDGDEGYPGELLTSITFEMTTGNDFIIEIKANTSKTTPINISTNTYFNLGGHSKGADSLYEHEIMINADRFCPTDENFIPTGMLKNVVNTLWDLRIPRKLGSVLMSVPYGGYDQNMCIHKTDSECLTFNARVVHPITGRVMELYSNQPGLQFYTCNFFPKKATLSSERMTVEDKKKLIKGINGIHYYKHQALCLATQNYPDAVNHFTRDPDFESEEGSDVTPLASEVFTTKSFAIIGKDDAEYYKHAGLLLMPQIHPDAVHRKNFPNCLVKPGQTYYHIIKFKFFLAEEVDIFKEDELDLEESDGMDFEGEQEQEEKDKDDLLDDKIEENGR